ncbi:hypothetical protein M5689_023205 [Euphorbia peplus]|nr:hypothetical protein M5689_023205 [Euphorbia peplus]
MDVEKNSGSPKITSHEETQETFSEKGDKLRLSKKEILGEMKMQLLIAVPLVMLNLSFGGMQIVGMSFVGHLGNLALSGASIAKFFCYHGWFHFDKRIRKHIRDVLWTSLRSQTVSITWNPY